LQPINYLLYLDYSAFGRIIIYNRHFKGAKGINIIKCVGLKNISYKNNIIWK